MIKASISTFSLSGLGCNTIEEVFSKVQRANFKFVDFKLDDYCKYFNWLELSEKEIYKHFFQIKEMARKYGIEIFQTHAPYSLYPHYLADGYIEKIIKSITATAALGAKYCVCHPLPFPISPNPNIGKEEQEFNIKWFSQFHNVLEEYKVTCCLENIYDWDKKEIRFISFSNIQVVKQTVEKLGRNFGVCLDTGHYNLYDSDLDRAIEILGRHLKVLHIHDNHGEKDEHILPYSGTIKWANFSNILKRIKYEGTLNLELSPQNCVTSDEILLKAKEIVDNINFR